MPAPIRAVFMGNDAWSVPTLERLARTTDVDVILVLVSDEHGGRARQSLHFGDGARVDHEHPIAVFEAHTGVAILCQTHLINLLSGAGRGQRAAAAVFPHGLRSVTHCRD